MAVAITGSELHAFFGPRDDHGKLDPAPSEVGRPIARELEQIHDICKSGGCLVLEILGCSNLKISSYRGRLRLRTAGCYMC
jgi:hypothetical protein